jgi:hypothetical protein
MRRSTLFLLLMLAVLAAPISLVIFSKYTRQARIREMQATDKPESAWMNLTEEQRETIRRSWK